MYSVINKNEGLLTSILFYHYSFITRLLHSDFLSTFINDNTCNTIEIKKHMLVLSTSYNNYKIPFGLSGYSERIHLFYIGILLFIARVFV